MIPLAPQLQVLHRIRCESRDELRRQLADVELQERQFEQHRAELLTAHRSAQAQTRELGQQTVDVPQLMTWRHFARDLQRQVGELENGLRALASRSQSLREELLTADQAVKVLERLAERRASQQRQHLASRLEREVADSWMSHQLRGRDVTET